MLKLMGIINNFVLKCFVYLFKADLIIQIIDKHTNYTLLYIWAEII